MVYQKEPCDSVVSAQLLLPMQQHGEHHDRGLGGELFVQALRCGRAKQGQQQLSQHYTVFFMTSTSLFAYLL